MPNPRRTVQSAGGARGSGRHATQHLHGAGVGGRRMKPAAASATGSGRGGVGGSVSPTAAPGVVLVEPKTVAFSIPDDEHLMRVQAFEHRESSTAAASTAAGRLFSVPAVGNDQLPLEDATVAAFHPGGRRRPQSAAVYSTNSLGGPHSAGETRGPDTPTPTNHDMRSLPWSPGAATPSTTTPPPDTRAFASAASPPVLHHTGVVAEWAAIPNRGVDAGADHGVAFAFGEGVLQRVSGNEGSSPLKIPVEAVGAVGGQQEVGKTVAAAAVAATASTPPINAQLQQKEDVNRLHMERSRERGLVKLLEMLERRVLLSRHSTERRHGPAQRTLFTDEALARRWIDHHHARRGLDFAAAMARGQLAVAEAYDRKVHAANYAVVMHRLILQQQARAQSQSQAPCGTLAATRPSTSTIATNASDHTGGPTSQSLGAADTEGRSIRPPPAAVEGVTPAAGGTPCGETAAIGGEEVVLAMGLGGESGPLIAVDATLPEAVALKFSDEVLGERRDIVNNWLRTLSTSTRRFSILQRWQWISEQYAAYLAAWREGVAIGSCEVLARTLLTRHAHLITKAHRDVIRTAETAARKKLQLLSRRAHKAITVLGQEIVARNTIARDHTAQLREVSVEYRLNRPDRYYFTAVYAEAGDRRILAGQEQLEFMLIYNEWHTLFHEVKKKEKAEEKASLKKMFKHGGGSLKVMRTACAEVLQGEFAAARRRASAQAAADLESSAVLGADDEITASDLMRTASACGRDNPSSPTPTSRCATPSAQYIRERRTVTEKYGYGAGYNIFDFSSDYVDPDTAADIDDPNAPSLEQYSVSSQFYPASSGAGKTNPRTKHIGCGTVMEADGRSWWLQYESACTRETVAAKQAAVDKARAAAAATRPSSACARYADDRAPLAVRANTCSNMASGAVRGTWFTSDFPKQQQQQQQQRTSLVPKRPKSAALVRGKSARGAF